MGESGVWILLGRETESERAGSFSETKNSGVVLCNTAKTPLRETYIEGSETFVFWHGMTTPRCEISRLAFLGVMLFLCVFPSVTPPPPGFSLPCLWVERHDFQITIATPLRVFGSMSLPLPQARLWEGLIVFVVSGAVACAVQAMLSTE